MKKINKKKHIYLLFNDIYNCPLHLFLFCFSIFVFLPSYYTMTITFYFPHNFAFHYILVFLLVRHSWPSVKKGNNV
ncbi:unnamed protein product [Trifolium pratense]|uniref:Uncharacterized protein n=1 Tax=Trifolium pratense TaxID=57577 RepID=A0ACB0KCI1_TRIPR|nr:unnamed protein product [Trifolium pratense]